MAKTRMETTYGPTYSVVRVTGLQYSNKYFISMPIFQSQSSYVEASRYVDQPPQWATKMGATQCQERVHSTVLAHCMSCRAQFVLDLCAACHLWCAAVDCAHASAKLTDSQLLCVLTHVCTFVWFCGLRFYYVHDDSLIYTFNYSMFCTCTRWGSSHIIMLSSRTYSWSCR